MFLTNESTISDILYTNRICTTCLEISLILHIKNKKHHFPVASLEIYLSNALTTR